MLLLKIHTNSVYSLMCRSVTAEAIHTKILHTDFLGGRSDRFDTVSKLVQGFFSECGAKTGLSH